MSESDLRRELSNLAPALRARLDASGFDPERLVALAAPLFARAQRPGRRPPIARNRVRGAVELPRPEDVPDAPAARVAGARAPRRGGSAAIRRGELAFCVLAGGMATRMGGVVKALVEAFDGHTFLDLRLARERRLVAARRRRRCRSGS